MAQKKKKNSTLLWWIIAIILFYVFTSAKVSTGIIEKKTISEKPVTVQEPIVVEKPVKTTKYREERTPFGERRCEQMNYNFSKTYQYSETATARGKRVGVCTYVVKNEEDIAGPFSFYVQFLKNGNINDGPDQLKIIEALGKQTFVWNLTIDTGDTLSCLLQSNNPPKRMKCFYLEPITYQIQEVPYTVEELKNVTEYRLVTTNEKTTTKQNVTGNIYTNRFFNYRQFFYFGY